MVISINIQLNSQKKVILAEGGKDPEYIVGDDYSVLESFTSISEIEKRFKVSLRKKSAYGAVTKM